MDFAILADRRIKLKESEKKGKYLDLVRELKNLWNLKITIIPIVIRTFGTIIKWLVRGLKDLEIRGRVETTQTIELLRLARILRVVPGDLRRLEETCCHSVSRERPSADADMKKVLMSNIKYIKNEGDTSCFLIWFVNCYHVRPSEFRLFRPIKKPPKYQEYSNDDGLKETTRSWRKKIVILNTTCIIALACEAPHAV